MDHQAFAQLLGNYGEFVGAIAVVGTLAYLAVQIRQSTLATRVSTHEKIINASRELFAVLYNDREFASLFARSIHDFESLDPEDKTRIHFYFAQVALFYKDCLEAHASGALDEDSMNAWERFSASIFATDGGGVWWNWAADSYPEWVRRRLDAAANAATPYDKIFPFVRPADA